MSRLLSQTEGDLSISSLITVKYALLMVLLLQTRKRDFGSSALPKVIRFEPSVCVHSRFLLL